MVISFPASINISPLPEFSEEQFELEEDINELPILENTERERRLFTHPYDFIIKSLKDQVDDHSIVLADEFQRRRVWDDNKSSRLIESLLINVPIPVCYFAELEDGSYSVIDGQQRLTAIYRYLNNEFSLKSLKVRPDLNKKRFHEIGVADSRTIRNRSLRCIVILKESDPQIRFDVFDRINTNAVQLNPQELRNSLYQGDLNKLIKKLSEDENFQRIRRVTNVDKRMQDCEIVLRFFAFHFQSGVYAGVLAPFLDSYLQKNHKMSTEAIEEHCLVFQKVISDTDFIFGDNAFRRFNHQEKQWDKVINKSIYDIITLYFAKIGSDVIRTYKEPIIKALKDLCNDPDFKAAISGATSATIRTQTRLDKWHQSLANIGISVDKIKIGSGNPRQVEVLHESA